MNVYKCKTLYTKKNKSTESSCRKAEAKIKGIKIGLVLTCMFLVTNQQYQMDVTNGIIPHQLDVLLKHLEINYQILFQMCHIHFDMLM